MKQLEERTNTSVEGHIKIIDPDSGRVIVDKRNAINLENMVLALVSSLSGVDSGYNIQSLAFGSGGVVVDTLGNISYNPTNTAIVSGSLYNETYAKSIAFSEEINPENNITFTHTPGSVSADIIIKCTLGYAEPGDQDQTDEATSVNADYIFNEIGIKTQNDLFLTHVIFHPVQKSANRRIQIIYTIRLTAGS
jgi:hypothetical protein